MSNTNEALADRIYKTRMSSAVCENPKECEIIEQVHTHGEIITHAKELLVKQMGLDLCSFAGLEEAEVREDDGDKVFYVDQSGNPVEFSEEMQFNAAIAVLNSSGHYFEAIPMGEVASGPI